MDVRHSSDESGMQLGAVPENGLLSRITLEHALYLLVAIAALVVRVVALDKIPLAPGEAKEALAVWDYWQPNANDVAIGSPAYFALTVLISQLLGFSDSVMRLVPAIFGSALVVLPWFLRERNGPLGAIITSVLLALSPLITFTARSAGGQSIALFSGLLLFVAWLRFQEKGEERWFYAVVLSLSIGLASAPLFYGIAATLALAWMIQAAFGPLLFTDEYGLKRPLCRPDRQTTRRGALLGVGIFVLLSTAFLGNLSGVGSSISLPLDWIGIVSRSPFGGELAWYAPFLAIMRYELAMALLGVLAIIWFALNRRPYPTLLIYWLGTSFLLFVIQRGNLVNALIVMLPGYLLVGRFVNDVFSEKTDWLKWAVMAALVLTGGVFYFNLSRYSRLAALDLSSNASYHLLLSFAALAFAITVLVFVWGWNRAVARQGAVSGLLVLLVIFTWGTTMWLNLYAANDTRELWISSATHSELPLLANTVSEISWQATNSATDLPLSSNIDDAALRWYLRDLSNAQFGSSLASSFDSLALITKVNSQIVPVDDYFGADFAYTSPNTPQQLSLNQSLHWWLFHQSPVPSNEERLILWLRSDLAGGVE